MCQPLLLLDIDGVISLFGFDARQPPAGRYALVDGIPHFLSTTAVGYVHELAGSFELVWCSGWEEKADEVLAVVLGLPRGLAHLSFAPSDGGGSRHWKLGAIDAFAGSSRALAWVDDAFDDSCHAWAAQRPGPTRLVPTDPPVGLTAEQTTGLAGWAACLRDESPGPREGVASAPAPAQDSPDRQNERRSEEQHQRP